VDAAGLEALQTQYPPDKYRYTMEPLGDGTFKLKSMSTGGGNDPFTKLLAALLGGGSDTDQPNSTGTGTSKRIPPPVITNR